MFTVNIGLDWIEQCFTSPPTQYRLYGRRLQSTAGSRKSSGSEFQTVGLATEQARFTIDVHKL